MACFSLDKPGLVYADGGTEGFDPGQHKTFRADDDGIIPLLETDWACGTTPRTASVEFIGGVAEGTPGR